MKPFSLTPIGIIRSPWKEKFAVPPQPRLIQDGGGELHLFSPYHHPEAVRGLEGFSHLWLLFIFHQTMESGWRPTVRPPRLGGNARIGVFATRSPFRPNPIGMSLVELLDIRYQKNGVILQLGSLDVVDGTPVIDIKPYLPYAEALPDARANFVQQTPDSVMPVIFSATAQQHITQLQQYPNLKHFITQVLAQDPRPAYHKRTEPQREYTVWLLVFNVRWRVTDAGAEVIAVEPR